MPATLTAQPRTAWPGWIAIAAALGAFLVTLDTTAVYVALPKIRLDLITNPADVSGLQWVMDGYALLYASLLLFAGALGDRIGNRTTFLAGYLIFLAASILCAAAPSLPLLILGRFSQGLGAALLIPASLSVVRHSYHNEKARARAIAAWVITGGTALAAGPVIGGLIIGLAGSRGGGGVLRAIFWLNVPFCLAGLFIGWKNIRTPHAAAGKLLVNLPAQLLGLLALAAATFSLIQGPRNNGADWSSPLILTALAIALLASLGFLYAEKSHPNPLVPRHLWSHKPFVAVVSVGLAMNYTFYGLLFLLTLYFSQIRHYTPVQTGLAFLPMTASVLLANFLAARIIHRRGPRPSIILGNLFCLAGALALLLLAPISDFYLGIVMLIIGTGMGLIVPAITSAALESVPPQAAGLAAGTLQTARQIGFVLGVALFGAALAHFHIHHPNPFPPAFLTVSLTSGTAAALGALLTQKWIPPHPQAS